jgi:hypothetical protein
LHIINIISEIESLVPNNILSSSESLISYNIV